jgi:hypothetical protein
MPSDPSEIKKSTRSMRLKKEREDNAGYRRSTVALSPVALAIAERLQDRLGLGLSIGVQKGPPIGVQKGPPSSSCVTGMAGVPFALVAA